MMTALTSNTKLAGHDAQQSGGRAMQLLEVISVCSGLPCQLLHCSIAYASMAQVCGTAAEVPERRLLNLPALWQPLAECWLPVANGIQIQTPCTHVPCRRGLLSKDMQFERWAGSGSACL